MSICVVGGHDKLGELLKAGERHFLRQTDVSVGCRVQSTHPNPTTSNFQDRNMWFVTKQLDVVRSWPPP